MHHAGCALPELWYEELLQAHTHTCMISLGSLRAWAGDRYPPCMYFDQRAALSSFNHYAQLPVTLNA